MAMYINKNAKRFIVVVVCLLFFYFLNYIITPSIVGEIRLEELCRPRGNLKFSSDIWRQSDAISGKRFEMVDDLLKSGLIIGLNETQVDKLLGRADIASSQLGERQLTYQLGFQRDYPVRSVWFPYCFPNQDQWKLEICIRKGKVYLAKVYVT